jgi:hypothetical protein
VQINQNCSLLHAKVQSLYFTNFSFYLIALFLILCTQSFSNFCFVYNLLLYRYNVFLLSNKIYLVALDLTYFNLKNVYFFLFYYNLFCGNKKNTYFTEKITRKKKCLMLLCWFFLISCNRLLFFLLFIRSNNVDPKISEYLQISEEHNEKRKIKQDEDCRN